MVEEENWHELLRSLISDPKQRQWIAEIADIHPITLLRWASGKSRPRWENLQPILEAFPRYRKQFTASLKAEYPQFFSEDPTPEESSLEIPSTFYSYVLKVYVSFPIQMRMPSVSTSILNQMVNQLDLQHRGVIAVIVQCVPPACGQKVRSLRTTLGRGTDPWPHQTEHQTLFLGAESQAGYTVISGHPVVIHNTAEKLRMFPAQHAPYEKSAFTIPLMLDNRTAGCLYVSSTQEYFFTQELQTLVQQYADLLVIAFEERQFYDLNQIEPGLMPQYQQQRPLLQQFQQRVYDCMVLAMMNQQPLTRTQAETIVWNRIEDELLRFAHLRAKQ